MLKGSFSPHESHSIIMGQRIANTLYAGKKQIVYNEVHAVCAVIRECKIWVGINGKPAQKKEWWEKEKKLTQRVNRGFSCGA